MVLFSYYRSIGVEFSSASLNLARLFTRWEMSSFLSNFPPHSTVCLLRPYFGGAGGCSVAAARIVYVRAAGSSATILSTSFYGRWALVILPSGLFKVLDPRHTYANFGTPQPEHARVHYPKAGSLRFRGCAPQVRGTVKNANDHPNGGRSRALRCSRTPWGLIAKKPRKLKS
jgi:hypothetical protein